MYQIIDNFLSNKDFSLIQDYFSNAISWKYSSDIVNVNDGNKNKDGFFHHIFYSDEPFYISNDIQIIFPILKPLNITKLFRCKSNFYSRTENIIEHDYHTDTKELHTVALFYINDNNGYTIIKDLVKVDSVKNRLLIFDGNLQHASTTSTDGVRMNVNINFRSDQINIKGNHSNHHLEYQ